MTDPRFQDPPADSVFKRLNKRLNRCTLCDTNVTNNMPARGAHLQRCPGWAAHCRARKSAA